MRKGEWNEHVGEEVLHGFDGCGEDPDDIVFGIEQNHSRQGKK